MKIGYLVKPNSKGQVVIPQQVRTKLNIDENTTLNLVLREGTLFLYPIQSVQGSAEFQDNQAHYESILNLTQGAWSQTEDWSKWEEKQNALAQKEAEDIKEAQKTWSS